MCLPCCTPCRMGIEKVAARRRLASVEIGFVEVAVAVAVEPRLGSCGLWVGEGWS